MSLAILASCGGAGGGPGAATGGKGGASDSIAELAARQGGFFQDGDGQATGVAPGGAPGTLRMERIETPVKLDGVGREWPSRVAARVPVKGQAAATFSCSLQYDADRVWVMGEVSDATVVRTPHFAQTDDHASLIVAVPGPAGLQATEIDLFAGKPGESAGSVRVGGVEVPGSRIVEAPLKDGYSFEAVVPWSAISGAERVRVGLRGVCRYHDGQAIVATGPGDARSAARLPSLPTSPELSLYEGLIGPRHLDGTPPRVELFVDIAGDAQKERVAVYGRYFTVVGGGYRGGKEYFFRDLGADLVRMDARDLTGRGKDDLIVRRRFATPTAQREWIEVWTFGKSDEPESVFSHEVAVTSGTRRVANTLRLASKEIEVGIDKPEGWDAATYREPVVTDWEPLLLPWGAVKSRTYRWDGTTFAKYKEIAQAPAVPAAPSSAVVKPVEPPTPKVIKHANLAGAMLDQFRKDRGVADGTKPTVDLETNLDLDPKTEHAVLLGRDLVVFGPGFKGGNGYSFITLSQFTDDKDVTELTARDVTGDGAADLLVRGVRRQTVAGAQVASELLLVYTVQNGTLSRVFAIETGRESEHKRMQGLVQFVPGKGNKGFEIDVRPGRATGWTEKTYPWTEDPPGGAIEPLLLPWGKVGALRFAWSGTSFARVP